MSQKKYDTTYAFSSITNLLVNPKNIEISQNTSVKDIHIIHSTINIFMDIGTGYGFCEHHYLRGKIVLSILSSINLVYFNTGYSVILYNIAFFST